MRRACVFLGVTLFVLVLGCASTKPSTGPVKQKEAKPGYVLKDTASLKMVYVDKDALKRIIVVFSEQIQKQPKFFGNYYNRAIAYYLNQEYQKAWADVYKAQELGGRFDPQFIDMLKKASAKSCKTK